VSAVGVFLGGEGLNELGSRCREPVYQNDDVPGVIQALLFRVRPKGWNVIGACKWSYIRKLRAQGRTPGDQQNVLGLVYEARRAKADVVAFCRDADNDPNRLRVIADAVSKAHTDFPGIAIAGTAAVPALEGWILALLGESGTENLSKASAQTRLRNRNVGDKDTQAMVEIVSNASMDQIPRDAASLRDWLVQAERALPEADPA
jgi:hypothetical protein